MSQHTKVTKPRGGGGGAFSPLVMIALVLVAVFAFSAFFTLTAFAPELTTGRGDARAHALSQSAVGYAGIIKLAEERGDWVGVSRQDRRGNPPALTVLTPERPMTDADIEGIGGASILIVLPKWIVAPSATHRGWVMRYGAFPTEMFTGFLGPIETKLQMARATGSSSQALTIAAASKDEAPQLLTSGPINQLQTISGSDIEPMVTDASNNIVLGHLPDFRGHHMYVLSDPDFLNTQGIANIDTARAGLTMLDQLHDPDEDEMVFDVTLNGFARARSVLRMAFEPPFLPATICLFAAACLLGWRAALRAGPSVVAARAIALGKSALADNSAALIHMANREARMGKGYAALTGASVAELVGVQRKTDEENAALLDSVGQSQGVSTKFSDLAAEAAAAQTPARMLEAAKKLHAWKEEMLRATG